ncbi:soluble quino protein glucose/sorbosone dehydrogenase [Hypoxylon trugodes]|uniref:soluble quino protein glucose/sorbosone dehydrogenase n=1 Tax=Hypoxylon trugodes TaxID=326681 RepID=UPI002198FF27|nr:soluble quino protein glucose/sorbosone dehydrogenase [Hypoxylon trugodes]KAI1383752.1 soluble quino protein glucose/sorbosone dehydrogenase [Hypoxylon trugodes]
MLFTIFGAAVIALLPIAIGGYSIPSSCPNVPRPLYPYELAQGWAAVKVADGLSSPRGIVVDESGRLLIVEEGMGISQHTIDINGCIVSSRKLVSMPILNHGIYFELNNRSLYASSASTVYRWEYDANTGNVSEPPTTIVSGMATDGHPTRTLIIPPNHPNLLVVSHGSNSNLDYAATDPTTARAIVKVFDISNVPKVGYNYARDGWNAGYGLRNEVGLVFDGNNMLWGVENSADQLVRDVNGTSVDIHNDNPAEELNFLGDVSTPNNAWYGYPTCFTIWETNATHGLDVGQQFVQSPNETFTDDTCAHMSMPPRLTFRAHSAPLDAKFDAPKYENLFATLHGSWDRYPPRDEGRCSSSSCARPVGLVFDAMGRLYMTSDTSGEVFMLSGVI